MLRWFPGVDVKYCLAQLAVVMNSMFLLQHTHTSLNKRSKIRTLQ